MIREKILKKIDKFKCSNARTTQDSNLYTDLGFDSLALVFFLTEIENELEICFDIFEMEECLTVKKLIALCERKTKEK